MEPEIDEKLCGKNDNNDSKHLKAEDATAKTLYG